MRFKNFKFLSLAGFTVLSLFLVTSTSASAVSPNNLFFNINASDTGSYDSSTPGFWNDLSTENRNGTVVGSLNYDSQNGALSFPNTGQRSDASGINYVDMGDGFNDFGNGITVEFEAHFGSTGIDNWERIFDFGNGQERDNIWVGNYYATNELAIELWRPTNPSVPSVQTASGRCKTADSVNAIQANTFKKYVITLDGTTCKIFINGVQVDTEVDGPAGNGSFDNFVNDANSLGSSYPYLPNNVERTSNFIGRSNWGVDITFNGAIKYVRIYTEALTASDVSNNAETYLLSYSSTGADSGVAPSSRSGNGLVTLASNTGNLAKEGRNFLGWATAPNQTTAIVGSYNLVANTTLYPVFSSLPSSPTSNNSVPSSGGAENLAATGSSFEYFPFALASILFGVAVVFIRRKFSL